MLQTTYSPICCSCPLVSACTNSSASMCSSGCTTFFLAEIPRSYFPGNNAEFTQRMLPKDVSAGKHRTLCLRLRPPTGLPHQVVTVTKESDCSFVPSLFYMQSKRHYECKQIENKACTTYLGCNFIFLSLPAASCLQSLPILL